MDEFRFKTRYAGSKRTQFLFEIAFYLVIAAFLLVIEAALFAPGQNIHMAGRSAGDHAILVGFLFCFYSLMREFHLVDWNVAVSVQI